MKRLVFVFFVLVANISLSAQDSKISTAFLSMPEDLLIGVDLAQRNELLLHSDSAIITVETDIDEDVSRVAFSENYIALATSEIGTVQIKLLPLVNNTDIIGVITTVCGPACSSRVDFYTTSWAPLKNSDLFPDKDRNWFVTKNINTDENVSNNIDAMLDMTPIKLSFSPDNNNISAEYDIKKYISADDYKAIEPFLVKEPVVFSWDKLSYKK